MGKIIHMDSDVAITAGEKDKVVKSLMDIGSVV